MPAAFTIAVRFPESDRHGKHTSPMEQDRTGCGNGLFLTRESFSGIHYFVCLVTANIQNGNIK